MHVIFKEKLLNCDYYNYTCTHSRNYHGEEQGELKTSDTYFYIVHGGILGKKTVQSI